MARVEVATPAAKDKAARAAAERARVVVMTAALRRLGALDLGPGVADVLAALDAEAVVRGHGRAVGAVRAVPLP